MKPTPFQQWLFNWGISEDDRLANSDQYLYWENIDCYSEPEFIQLSKALIDSNTMTDFAYQMVEVNDRVTNSRTVIVFSEDKIYHVDNSTAVYSASHLWQLNKPAFVLWDYLYWVVNNGSTSAFTLDRITTQHAQSSTWTSVDVSQYTLSTNNYSEYSSVYIKWGVALISLGSNISILDPATWVTDYTSLIYDEIVGITGTFGSFYLFTETGRMHIWDGVSENITDTIELNIKPAKVYQYWTAVYAITGGQLSEKGFYQFDGSSFQPIFKKTTSNLLDQTKGKFSTDIWAMTNDRENFYLIDEWGGTNDSKIVYYGAKVSWTQRGFHNINTASTLGSAFKDFTSLLYTWGMLYAWWEWDGFGVKKLSTTTLNTTGHIITNINDYDVGIIRKSSQGLYFRAWNIDAQHTITVAVSTDGSSFTDIHTVNSTPDKGIVRIPNQLLIDAGVWVEFEDITFKFTLTTDDNVSPTIYRGYTHYIEFNPII